MTYFRLHAFWKSQVTNLKRHPPIGRRYKPRSEIFSLPLILPAIAEVQPIEKPRARRRHLRFEDRTSPNWFSIPKIASVATAGMSWFRLSEQTLRVDKWSPAGVRLPNGAAAGLK
jgi:hypothetical protein